jgi:hypothetical protein
MFDIYFYSAGPMYYLFERDGVCLHSYETFYVVHHACHSIRELICALRAAQLPPNLQNLCH